MAKLLLKKLDERRCCAGVSNLSRPRFRPRKEVTMRFARVAIGYALAFTFVVHPFFARLSAADASGAAPHSGPVRHFSVSLGTAALAINEFVPGPAHDWDGSSAFSSRDDEWVEVVNPGTAALDLTPFFITDSDTIPRYGFTGSLAAGARLVVFGKQSYDWERATGHPAFGFSLSNSGDAVMLWQVTAGDTVLIDSYAYKSHEAAADRAIGRLPDASGAWSLFDGLNPYTGSAPPHGNGCSPSLGGENACTPTPVQNATWGRMKALYR